jgi:mRNA interferase RelE/StbE
LGLEGYISKKKIAYSKQAIKTLMRIQSNESARIRAKISQCASDPDSMANNVKKLQGGDSYRLRVGDWRIIFDENDVVIEVIKVGAWGDVYKGPER